MISYKLKGMLSQPHLILIPGDKGKQWMGIVHAFDDEMQTHLLVYTVSPGWPITVIHNTGATRKREKLGVISALNVISACLVDWAEGTDLAAGEEPPTEKQMHKLNEERVDIIRCLGKMWTRSTDDYQAVKDAFPRPSKTKPKAGPDKKKGKKAAKAYKGR